MSLRYARHACLIHAFGLALAMTATPHAQAATDSTAVETARTEAGVLAVEDHWSRAEATGDTTWLSDMLLPAYRTVGIDGTVHERAALLASATRHRGSTTGLREMAAYMKAHPAASRVLLEGDLAIVSFYDPATGPQRIRSSDVFVYRDGHWHAIYSQHSSDGQPFTPKPAAGPAA